jgi:hypothetical protein
MKVSLNSAFIDGPYGGGMQIAFYLRDFLIQNDVRVVNTLKDDDIDIVLHLNPFPFLMKAAAFSFYDAYLYKLKHPDVILVNQINECDERKSTRHMNRLLAKVSKYSDYNIFIASWLKPLFKKFESVSQKPSRIILNGADERIFNRVEKKVWKNGEKMKIVTHHWGANYLKGHDIYQKLDVLLEDKFYADKFEFTFIGNIPAGLEYKHARVLKPLAGKELAGELKKHHIYLTASRNEPAGLHHIEGALCGLPLLYINSGALPEYCSGFGIEFTLDNFQEKLIEMSQHYSFWLEKNQHYSHTAHHMANEYFQLFKELDQNRRFYALKLSKFKRKILGAGIFFYGSMYEFSIKIMRKINLLR